MQEEFVPNAVCAAILPKRDIVQKKYDVALQEDRLAQSFASARNTPACSPSTLRAMFELPLKLRVIGHELDAVR